MLAQHRARGLDRHRIEIDGDNTRSAQPGGGDRVQAGPAADIQEGFAGEPVLAEETHEAAFSLRQRAHRR